MFAQGCRTASAVGRNGHGAVGTIRLALRRTSHTAPPVAANLPLKALAAGTVAGSAGSLVGMGGGFVAIPAMTSSWMGLSQHQAHATSLVSVLFTGAAGGASFALAGSVDWGVAATVAGGGVFTANLGARLASRLPGYLLKGLLGAFMCCVGPAVYFKPMLVAQQDLADGDARELQADTFAASRMIKLVAVGGAVGIFCGIFGVGGGAVTVPAVSFCLPELSHHQALGTSLVAMVPPAIAGLIQHVQSGVLVKAAALPLAVGTASGSFITGRFLALELDEDTMRKIFSITMIVLGVIQLRGAVRLAKLKSRI